MTLEFGGIQISGLGRDPVLRARASSRIGAALKPLQVKPVAALVSFFDDNGPRGGRAVRCALTVRLPYRPTVRVEHTAETPHLAFDGGFASLERQLERYRERDRDNKRRPKKYYLAKRLLEGESAAAARRPRRAQ